MTEDRNPLYPNRGGETETGVSRRRLLAGSATAGAAATAGCSSEADGDAGGDGGSDATVFVFNTGDMTASLIDPATDEVVATQHVGLTASFPSNQYTPDLVTDPGEPLWLNVDDGVRALEAGSLSEAATVDTGSGANWQEVTPDGGTLVVSAREPAHTQYRVDADPDSASFGEVTAELDRTDEGGRGDEDGPGPCDVSIHPEGAYAYVPDIFGDTLTVLDVETFEIETQVAVDSVAGEASAPWMGTVAPDGQTLLVEHDEGDAGTESVWDLTDPANPEEAVRLTAEDGLGEMPLTSEIGPDSETGYVFTPGTEDVTVVDLAAGDVDRRIDLGGSAFVGTWDPDREKLYVPVRDRDEVAVVDHAEGEITDRISVGSEPYGATAARVRPETTETAAFLAHLSALGVDLSEGGTSYCIGECACGHRL